MTIERFQSNDTKLEGADIGLLSKAIKDGSLYTNKAAVESKISDLEAVYTEFLEDVAGMIDDLAVKRK